MSTETHKKPNVPVHKKKTYFTRTASKDKRLKMYRDSGKLSHEKPDTKIAPDRRWFGNTHTLTQEELSNYRNAYTEATKDQFQVILHRRKLPNSLVEDKDDKKKFNLLKAESFSDAFGKKARRLKPELEANSLRALIQEAEERQGKYEDKLARQARGDPVEVDMGQTKRVLSEVYKVIDSSDVIIEVLDARDPLGTRSRKLEDTMAKEYPGKHIIFLINKCDLVPKWVVEKAVRRLTRERPTIAFRASTKEAFGNEQLTALLRQFAQLHKDRAHLSVGFVGYPNVGKSSVINTLRRENVCPVAPIPGETKVWRYIALTKKIYLIDCPGHVYPEDVSDVDRVLKSVTRTERIQEPEHYIQNIIDLVRPQYIKNTYQLGDYEDADDLLEKLAIRMGRLIRGGKPDTHASSIRLISDFQRGRLPWFKLVHSRDIEQPLKREHVFKVERANLEKLSRTVKFDEVDEVEQPDEEEEVIKDQIEAELEQQDALPPPVDEADAIIPPETEQAPK